MPLSPLVDEPLLLSAPLAWQWAACHCRVDPATGRSCASNHGVWQYLRLLGLASAPAQHAAFFREAFDCVAQGVGPIRVLVSGAADYSMLAQALAAFRARGLAVEATVLDICETSLMLNRWYAAQLRHPLRSALADILDYTSAEPFDVICTHFILGRFAPEQRQRLLAAWSGLLRRGGIAVTVNRLRQSGDSSPAGFSEQRAAAFGRAVQRRADAMPALGVAPHLLAQAAETYAGCHRSWPVRSLDELSGLFQAQGFTIRKRETMPYEMEERLDGDPLGAHDRLVGCVFAQKPG